jgi:ABC-type amino acid transport substrate-binding protein
MPCNVLLIFSKLLGSVECLVHVTSALEFHGPFLTASVCRVWFDRIASFPFYSVGLLIEYLLLTPLKIDPFFYIYSQQYVTPSDGQWGVQRPNGTWTGLVGDVMSRRADIAACHVTVSQSRRAAVDFSYGYFYEDYRILTKAPTDSSRALVVLRPFSVLVSLQTCNRVSRVSFY